MWDEIQDMPGEIFDLDLWDLQAAAEEPLFSPEVEQRLEALCKRCGC